MKNHSIIGLIVTSFVFFSISCNEPAKRDADFGIIEVDKAIGKDKILNLGDYVQNIQYIKLETSNNILLGQILQIVYENNKFFLLDHPGKTCKIFDINGDFKGTVGAVGQGPGEYPHCFSFDYFLDTDMVMLRTSPSGLFFYNSARDLTRITGQGGFSEQLNGARFRNTMFLDSTTYISDIVSFNKAPHRIVIFNDLQILDTIPIRSHIDKDDGGLFRGVEIGVMYRFKDNIIHYKPLEDTVFSIDNTMEMKEHLVFQYGKHKWRLKEDVRRSDWIYVKKMHETSQYVFIEFAAGPTLATERFAYVNLDGAYSQDNRICGVFNKHTGKLSLMKQPIPAKLGFKNDIDGGLPFWPKYITSSGELVDYYQAFEFIAAFEGKENIPEDVKAILKDLKDDDNPVVAIAKLKE
jgi:hypothetical protein